MQAGYEVAQHEASRAGFEYSLPILRQLKADMGIEAFCKWAVPPWFRLSADAQWEQPFNGRDDNHLLGLRAQFKIF